MLVLTRKPNEKIVLPDLGITIQVVAIKGNVVRIGIDAPRDVSIMRQELLETPAGPPAKAESRLITV